MQITGCHSENLKNYYSQLATNYPNEGVKAQTYLSLISGLEAVSDRRHIYCLTSVDRLCFLSEDNYETNWWVIAEVLQSGHFSIEYLMPENTSPWKNAYVRGEARNLEEAISMIMVAINNSEGWQNHLA